MREIEKSEYGLWIVLKLATWNIEEGIIQKKQEIANGLWQIKNQYCRIVGKTEKLKGNKYIRNYNIMANETINYKWQMKFGQTVIKTTLPVQV